MTVVWEQSPFVIGTMNRSHDEKMFACCSWPSDGVRDGWDSEEEEPETEEQRLIRENPDVAVIENLEDIYKVSIILTTNHV